MRVSLHPDSNYKGLNEYICNIMTQCPTCLPTYVLSYHQHVSVRQSHTVKSNQLT